MERPDPCCSASYLTTGWSLEKGSVPFSSSELVQAYTRILMVEQNYRYILDYWLWQYQEGLLTEMEEFFGGKPGA